MKRSSTERPHRLWMFALLSLSIVGAIHLFAMNLRQENVRVETELVRVGEAVARIPGNLSGALLLGRGLASDRADVDIAEETVDRGRRVAMTQLQADLAIIESFLTDVDGRKAVAQLTIDLDHARTLLAEHDLLARRLGDYGGNGLRQHLAAMSRALDAAVDGFSAPQRVPLRNLVAAKSYKDAFFAGLSSDAQINVHKALTSFAEDVRRAGDSSTAERTRLLEAIADYDRAFQQVSGALLLSAKNSREIEAVYRRASSTIGGLLKEATVYLHESRAARARLTNTGLVVVGVVLTLVVAGYIWLSLRTADDLQARERQLKAGSARMHDLARVSSDLFWEIDASGVIRAIDGPETFSAFYGPRMIGQRFHDVLRDLGVRFSDDLDIASIWMRQKPFRDLEYQVVMPATEHVFWYSLSGLPVLDEHGEFAGYRCASKDITQSKARVDQLRDVMAAIEAASDGVLIFAKDNSEILYANAAIYRIVDAPSGVQLTADLLTQRLRIGPEEADALRTGMREGVARSGQWSGRLKLHSGDIEKFVLVRVTRLDDGRFLHVVTDITAEEAKTSQLRDIGTAIEAAGDGIMFFAADGSMLFANASAHRMFDVPMDSHLLAFRERLGMTEESARVTREAIREGVRRTGQWAGGFTVTRGDGTRAPLFVRVTGGLDDGKLLYVVTDMTELTQARLEFEKQLEKTREQNALVARALDTVQDYICIEDKDGGITYANKILLRELGCGMEDVIGLSFFANVRVKYDDNERLKRDVMGGLTRDGVWNGEVRLTRPDGRRQIFNLHVSRLADGGALYSGVDITVQRAQELEEAKLKQRLADAERMEAIGRLAGGIAHDFNNIIGATRAFADLLVEDLPGGSDQRKYAERIVSASRRATELVKEVMTFSRASQAERRPTELTAVFAEGLDILAAKKPALVTLNFHNLPKPAVVEANASQVLQVIVNLVMNAFDALEGHAGVVTVRAECMSMLAMGAEAVDAGYREERSDGIGAGAPVMRHGQGQLESGVEYVKLTVEDTGPGMSRTTLQRIFEPFFTTKGRDRGTGLGVPVVSSIVAAHGGILQISTRRTRGSSVAVYLPISNKLSVASEEKPSENTLRGSERILIVDDEIDLADAISIGLTRLGYETAPVYTPTEAITLFKEGPEDWDVLISDQVMPHMKGLQLVRKARELSPKLKIILCTGHSDAATDQTARQSGADLFLHKPVTAERLAQAVRNLVDR